MRILKQDFKNGEVSIRADTLDDLWYLNSIIEKGDLISGATERKVKLNEEGKSAKKNFYVEIKVEKTEYGKGSNELRINGLITQGPEDIPKGIHQVIEVREGTDIKIRKEGWLAYQKEKIKEASENKRLNILVAVFDREEALFALLKRYGYEIILEIQGDVQKKADVAKKDNKFFADIADNLKELSERHSIHKIILASPAFWKEYVLKLIKDKGLSSKIVQATCSSVGKNGIEEVLKRDEVKTALLEDRMSQEFKLVEQLLAEVAKEGLAAYGKKEATEAVNSGNIKFLLVTDSFIRKNREEGNFSEVDNLLKNTEKNGGEIRIISSEHEGGRRLDGLGGIGAILRYKNY